MAVDISSPDLETRSAILQAKCQEKGFSIPPEAIQLIAASIQSNIRELEGALNKIIAYHQLKGLTANKESIKTVLATLETQTMKKSLTSRDLINEVARFYDITIDDIVGQSREKKLSFPRQIIMFLLRNELKMSFPAIGNELGGRDHTTAMHAHNKIGLEIENDPKLRQEIELIKQRLYAEHL
jgi:chromosomal replication initiator protein